MVPQQAAWPPHSVAVAAAAVAISVLFAVAPLLGAAARCKRFRCDPADLLWCLVIRPLGLLRLRLLCLCRGPGEVLYVCDDGSARRLACAPPRPDGTVRCVCISDTHLLHRWLKLPAGDVLLHAGDSLLASRAVDTASLSGLADFNSWLAEQPHTHKVLVAGNHDGALAALGAAGAQERLSAAVYLQDSLVDLAGLRIYGSPLSVGRSKNAAFQPQGGYRESASVAAIPEGLDILLTHGPPGSDGQALGRASAALRERVRAASPRYHVFGHWHLGYGVAGRGGGTLSINASSADALFAVTNPPVVFDLPPRVPAER